MSQFCPLVKKIQKSGNTTIKMNNLEDLELSEHPLVLKYLSFFSDLITQHLCDKRCSGKILGCLIFFLINLRHQEMCNDAVQRTSLDVQIYP